MLTEAVRGRDFPSLAGRTYLNSAAEGIPPLAVGAALQQYFADKQLGMDGRERHAAHSAPAALSDTARFASLARRGTARLRTVASATQLWS